MTRQLRQRHRRIAIVLGVVLPVALAVGIAARKPVPSVTSLPNELVTSHQKFVAIEWERADLFTKMPIQVRLLRESAGAGHFALEFSAAKDFVKADLLVYWLPANSTITDTIPDQAILLGGFNSGLSLPVPLGVAGKPGTIVLYSLADNAIVAVSQLVTL